MKTLSQSPDRWLQGRCLSLTRHHGLTDREAIVEAIAEWQEQERLASEAR